MKSLLEHVRHHGTWTAGLLVLLCLLGGLRVGDAHAGRAAQGPATMQARLQAEQQRLAALRVLAAAEEAAAASARQLAARAALAAYLAGRPDAAALLPSGMRFVCADRAAGRCVVIAESGQRTTRLVWPRVRPAWAAPLGLPPGPCGIQPQPWSAAAGCP
ncbi:MAG TPA: hypothetical protein VH857_11220 [Actinomycetes bacterium]|jgi:hypothetical protein|nr:hypothetical protein [Actinomycetes bacterium]